jgi:hypothetical protein
MRLSSQQASKSAASAMRLQSADKPTLYARTPVVQLPKVLASEDRTLLIERIDRRGERHKFKIDDTIAAASVHRRLRCMPHSSPRS